jgi:mitogen-activated protein kinase 1/3
MAILMDIPIVHKDDISREQLKDLLYEEIMTFRPAPIT